MKWCLMALLAFAAADGAFAAADVLVRYPDYPAAVERDAAYAVRVRQGDETRRLVVWNHCEKSILDGRTRGGDVNRRFCEFAFAGSPVTVDIAVREDVRCYKVFPARKGLKHSFHNGVISVTLTEPTYFGIQLNDYDKTILSVFADAPEKAEDVPAPGAAGVLRVEGWVDAKGADGVLDVPKDVREVYHAPGAVLNARLKITHPHVRLHGRGMILDPMSDIFRYDQIQNPSRGFVVVKATDVTVEGVKLVDARTFNFMAWNYGSQSVTFRNVKVLSSMMCSDGFTVGGKNLLVDNAWVYVGDNALVVSGIRDATFRNVAIGTSCKAIFPQCSNLRVRMENVDVFRADEGLIANEYNGVLRRNNKWSEMGTGRQKREPGPQDLEHQTEDFVFDGLSAVDATYIAYVFRCKNMGDLPKTFAFRNLSVPHVSGRDSWRLAGQTNGVSVAVLNDPAKWLNTSNCRFAVTNLYLAGRCAAAFPSYAVEPKDAAILDLSVVTDEAQPRTVPLDPDRVEVNWTCPEERKARLPAPLANLLEDRPATRSIWQRCPSWNVKLDACTRDETGAVVYRLRQCEKWSGMQAVVTERVKAAGFGKYRLAFEAKATSETPFALRVSAITNEKRNLVHMEGDRSGTWKSYETEIDLSFDPAVTDLVALMLSVSKPVDELCFRNFRLTKAQERRPLRVLAIGNSYTQSLHPEFANVARAAGCDLDLTIFAIGGNSLSNHYVNAVAALADSALKPYWVNGRKANLPEVLAGKAYDVVVLQEQSAEGMDPQWFDPWADRLIAFVRSRQPLAKFWLQQTWSDPVASFRITDRGVKGTLGLTQDDMFAALEKNYAVQAKRLGARIVPVGAALQLYRKGLPVRLVKPTKAELAALKDGEVPDLKGELAGWWYWGKGKTWESDYGVYRLRQDFQHLNPEGRYLQACVWTAALFGVDLAKLGYAPDLGADFARRAPFIRACAMKAVNAQ